MKKFQEYKRIIATIERSAGNAEVGDMWTETKSFEKDTYIYAIVDWAMKSQCGGRLTITIDGTDAKDGYTDF